MYRTDEYFEGGGLIRQNQKYTTLGITQGEETLRPLATQDVEYIGDGLVRRKRKIRKHKMAGVKNEIILKAKEDHIKKLKNRKIYPEIYEDELPKKTHYTLKGGNKKHLKLKLSLEKDIDKHHKKLKLLYDKHKKKYDLKLKGGGWGDDFLNGFLNVVSYIPEIGGPLSSMGRAIQNAVSPEEDKAKKEEHERYLQIMEQQKERMDKENAYNEHLKNEIGEIKEERGATIGVPVNSRINRTNRIKGTGRGTGGIKFVKKEGIEKRPYKKLIKMY